MRVVRVALIVGLCFAVSGCALRTVLTCLDHALLCAAGVAAASAGGRGVGAFGTQAAPTTPGLRIAAARRPVAVATSDYSKLDEPAINRLAAAAGDGLRHDDPSADEEILDIPAFLRRQAD